MLLTVKSCRRIPQDSGAPRQHQFERKLVAHTCNTNIENKFEVSPVSEIGVKGSGPKEYIMICLAPFATQSSMYRNLR